MNIVNLCKDHGCNQIFVSGIVYRPDAVDKVKQLNHVLYQWSFLHGYTFIFNENIKEGCLDSGKLHLTTRGSARLSSNFRRALNKPYVWLSHLEPNTGSYDCNISHTPSIKETEKNGSPLPPVADSPISVMNDVVRAKIPESIQSEYGTHSISAVSYTHLTLPTKA